MAGRWRHPLVLLALALALSACGGTAAPAAPTAASESGAAPAAATEAPAPATDAPAAATQAPAAEVPAETTQAGAATARVGWGGSPDSLNPGVAVLSEAYTIFELVYSSMYELQLDGSYELDLAESVEMSEEGRAWTFKLRPNITFHDGEPLTAQDVVFSYNFYQQNADFPYLNVYTEYFESVEAPDDSTVVLTLSEAIPNLESQLIFLYVLPEHVWSAHAEGAAASEFANDEMIGSGPFKLAEYAQNEFVRLDSNTQYFAAPPKIDGVVFQTFNNQDALVQALRTGQVDMISEMPATAVPTLRNEPNIKLVNAAPFSPSIRDIFFNQIDPADCPADAGGKCTGHPALRDRNVRLALAHATDKQQIIDVALLGLGTPGLTLIPDGLGLWYNNTLQDYAYDVDEANRILDEAGYADADGDGVRDMPDGSRPLTFRLNWPNDVTEAPRIGQLLSEMWGQVGVTLESQEFDPDALTAICCPAFDYDVIIWGWGSDPDPALLLSVNTTEAIPTGSSETGYSNPEYDELYAQQAVTLDQEARKQIVWRMQEILHQDVVYVIPYYEQAVQAYRTDRFTGWLDGGPKVALEDVSSLRVIEPVS
jgi:peptide/nickel transport system substrate-binding protein